MQCINARNAGIGQMKKEHGVNYADGLIARMQRKYIRSCNRRYATLRIICRVFMLSKNKLKQKEKK